MTPRPTTGSHGDGLPDPVGPGGHQLMGIGDVARILDREFPGVTVSKLRYLESRGLITPTRTRGGSRRYSQRDVRRLRFILRCQQQEFLPLEVIATRLDEGLDDAADDGLDGAGETGAGATPRPGSARALTDHGPLLHLLRPRRSTGSPAPLSREAFIKRSRCTAEQIEQMSQHGLLTRWDSTDLAMSEIVQRLDQYGIEPRHLRWLGQSADRAVALVDASLPARSDSGRNAAAEHDEARRRLIADLMTLQLLMIRQALTPG